MDYKASDFLRAIGDQYGDVTFHGRYKGAASHEGIAVKCDSAYEYAMFCMTLVEYRLHRIAHQYPLMTNLGQQQLYSWETKYFTQEELETIDAEIKKRQEED